MSKYMLIIVVLAACGSRPKQDVKQPEVTTKGAKPTSGDLDRVSKDATTEEVTTRAPRFSPIYFAYDVAELPASARDELSEVAAFLEKNPGASVTIAGHADERGTPEYNIALGDERARAAKDYLVRLGIDARRIRTTSHGEERPVATGSDETSWSQNRRDDLEVILDERAGTR